MSLRPGYLKSRMSLAGLQGQTTFLTIREEERSHTRTFLEGRRADKV